MPPKVWSIMYLNIADETESDIGDSHAQLIAAATPYLSQGWEPFAIVYHPSPGVGLLPPSHMGMWLRRQV